MFSDTRNICIPKGNTTLQTNKTKKNKVGDKDDFDSFAFPSNSKFKTSLLSTKLQFEVAKVSINTKGKQTYLDSNFKYLASHKCL